MRKLIIVLSLFTFSCSHKIAPSKCSYPATGMKTEIEKSIKEQKVNDNKEKGLVAAGFGIFILIRNLVTKPG